MTQEELVDLAQLSGFQVSWMIPSKLYKIEPIGGNCIVELSKFAKLIREQCIQELNQMQLIGPYKDVQDATLKDAARMLDENK